MKYQEGFVGSRSEFADFVKKSVPDMFSGKLEVEGKTVKIPADSDLDYKVKYDEDEEGASITIKVSWEDPSVDFDLE